MKRPAMKMEVHAIPDMMIERFANEHGLVMEIRERPRPENDPARFYAFFKHSEIKGDGVLIGEYGNGRTEEEAIRNYAKAISLKTLVLDSYTPERREIEVPRLR